MKLCPCGNRFLINTIALDKHRPKKKPHTQVQDIFVGKSFFNMIRKCYLSWAKVDSFHLYLSVNTLELGMYDLMGCLFYLSFTYHELINRF